jgi:hypothetical protein
MPELIIKYKSKKTLDALLDFAKYFNFSVILPSKSKEQITKINGVSVIPADSSIDTSELESIFSAKNIDAKVLRQKAWQRTK